MKENDAIEDMIESSVNNHNFLEPKIVYLPEENRMVAFCPDKHVKKKFRSIKLQNLPRMIDLQYRQR